MAEWVPVGCGGYRSIGAAGQKTSRRVLNAAAATAPVATTQAAADAEGFSVEHCQRVALTFVLGTFAGTVRLYWWDRNAEEWVPETVTITLPHAGAPAGGNTNHIVQRETFGYQRCAVVIETNTGGGNLQVWASGSDPTN